MDKKREQKPTETDTPQKLSKKSRLFINVLLRSKTIKQACDDYQCNRDFYYQLRKNPVFLAELEKAQAQLVADAYDTLKMSLNSAIEKMTELVGSRDEIVALRASCAVSDLFLKAVSMQAIEERLAALEQSAAVNK